MINLPGQYARKVVGKAFEAYAEALFATALGLLAAIPAVMAYNKFSTDINRFGIRLEGFADDFSGILSRQVDQGDF